MSVYLAVLAPGDTMLGMDLTHGGHLTHGHPLNQSGKQYEVVSYGVHKDTETIDYDRLRELALENKPKLIVCGASAYPRIIDFARLRAIADEAGSLLMADIAHIAGLVAAGPPSVPGAPLPLCHHHDAQDPPRSPRRDDSVWRGVGRGHRQGGLPGDPGRAAHAHHRRQGAWPSPRRCSPEWKEYQKQVVANSAALCEAIAEKGWRIVSGGTDNHLFLIDLGTDFISGKKAERWLGLADITVNKNTVPFDTRKPYIASGLRIGTPAVTSRGMGVEEMKIIAESHRPGALGRRGQRGCGEIRSVQCRDGGRQGRRPRPDREVPAVLSGSANRPTCRGRLTPAAAVGLRHRVVQVHSNSPTPPPARPQKSTRGRTPSGFLMGWGKKFIAG